MAMSGGVDSSVAAGLLLEQGYPVTGVFMKNWSEQLAGACPWEADEADVKKVCGQLGISFHVYNFEKEYRRDVLASFFKEYKAGRTPNPDVLCNSKIKFDVFQKRALREGADLIATGHYVRHVGSQLLKGVDPNKDQSYFLWQLAKSQIEKSMFPVGALHKTEIRRLAKKWGLANAEKPDSQGICFVGTIDVGAFLRQHITGRPGDVVTADGTVVGRHDGIAFYTIGQRHGLGIGGGIPYFVAAKDFKKNQLIVAHGNRDPLLFAKGLRASHVHWQVQPRAKTFTATAKIRYRQPDQKCAVTIVGSRLTVTFAQPQRAVTPGQSIVFYKGQTMLGGAVIEKAL